MNVYVDTGAWVAYFDQSDRFHPLVTSYVQATLLQAVDRLVTSDYVLDETVSYLRYHVSHATALTALRTLSALAQAHHIQHAVTVDKDFVIFGLVILPEELARFVLSPSQP